jgi:hypothetical protein
MYSVLKSICVLTPGCDLDRSFNINNDQMSYRTIVATIAVRLAAGLSHIACEHEEPYLSH